MSKISNLPALRTGSTLARSTGNSQLNIEYLPPERPRLLGLFQSNAERERQARLTRIRSEVEEAQLREAGALAILEVELGARARKHERLHGYQQETSAMAHQVFEHNERFKHKVNDAALTLARERVEAARRYNASIMAAEGDEQTKQMLTMVSDELRDQSLEEALGNAATIRRNADQAFRRTVSSANLFDED